MNTEVVQVFDPAWQFELSQPAEKTTNFKQADARELFHSLKHISEYPDCLSIAYQMIKQQLAETQQKYQSRFTLHYQFDQLDDMQQDHSMVFFTKASLPDFRTCILQSTPVLMTAPDWLLYIAQAATGETKLATELMGIYLNLTQSEEGKSSLKDQYLSVLISLGISIPAVHTREFTRQSDVPGSVFEFAAVQLALAHYPRVMLPEILGYTLAYCQSKLLVEYFYPIEQLTDHPYLAHFCSQRHRLLSVQIPKIIAVINEYLQQFGDQSDQLWQRIQAGFWLYQLQMDRYYVIVKPTQSAQQALVNLIKQKAPAAVGHHRKVILGDKTLDQWFTQTPFDSKNFLHALKQSNYYNAQNPADSPLLKLFDFQGPMFGVMNSEECKTLQKGLTSIAMGINEKSEAITSLRETRNNVQPQAYQTESVDFSKLDNRQLYFYLLNADLYPDVQTTAKHHVEKIVWQSRLFNRLPFTQYQHQRFEDYVQSLYQQEIKTYQPLTTKPRLSKQAYIWGIEQFAPTILTDGCWLQTSHQLNHHAIGDILFKIYTDEMGNGILQQNHPYVYRQLLNSLNIKLPAIHTRLFSEHAGFIDSAFDLPVYLMAISKFPAAFLPELLGLNLAIELSGLGKVYLRLAEELEYWGINAKIVKLHITIDNIASGHAAMAIKAIQLHLDEILAGHGELAVQHHWQRVYTGYCSLQTASLRFKYALIYRYGLRVLKGDFKKQ